MPALLLRFLPWILGAVAALGVFSVVNGWRKDAAELPRVREQFSTYRTEIETARRVREEVSNEYQGELARLRGNQRPAPAVRLCSPAPAVSVQTGSPGGRDGASPEGGELPGRTGQDSAEGPGPDIGADLYALARRADETAAQLRACQAFVIEAGKGSD